MNALLKKDLILFAFNIKRLDDSNVSLCGQEVPVQVLPNQWFFVVSWDNTLTITASAIHPPNL